MAERHLVECDLIGGGSKCTCTCPCECFQAYGDCPHIASLHERSIHLEREKREASNE